MNNPSDYKTGDMHIKVYTKNPLNAVVKSSDEPKYDYEFPIDPVELFPSSLPGKYSMTYNLAVGIANNELPKAGRYPALLKVYYGAGKVASAPIYFVVLENARLVSSPPSRSLPPSPAVRRPAVNPGAAGRGTPTELH